MELGHFVFISVGVICYAPSLPSSSSLHFPAPYFHMAPIWLPNAFSAAYCLAEGHKLGLDCVNVILNFALLSGLQRQTMYLHDLKHLST